MGIGQLVDERSRGHGTGDVVGEGEEGEVTLGMGGGGSRKKGKKRKGKPKQRESQGGNEEGKAEENWNIPPDPYVIHLHLIQSKADKRQKRAKVLLLQPSVVWRDDWLRREFLCLTPLSTV